MFPAPLFPSDESLGYAHTVPPGRSCGMPKPPARAWSSAFWEAEAPAEPFDRVARSSPSLAVIPHGLTASDRATRVLAAAGSSG